MPYCADCQTWPCKCAELEALDDLDDDELDDDELDDDEDDDSLSEDELEDDDDDWEDLDDDDDDDDDELEDDDDDDELGAMSDDELRREAKAAPPLSAAHCHAKDDEGDACNAPGVVAYPRIGALCGRHIQLMRDENLLELWDNRVIVLNGGPVDDDDDDELEDDDETTEAAANV